MDPSPEPSTFPLHQGRQGGLSIIGRRPLFRAQGDPFVPPDPDPFG